MTSVFLTVIITAFVVSALCGGIVRRARREAAEARASDVNHGHALSIVLGDLQNAQEDNEALTKERTQLVGFVASLTNENASLRALHSDLIAAGDALRAFGENLPRTDSVVIPTERLRTAAAEWHAVAHCGVSLAGIRGNSVACPALRATPPAAMLGQKGKA